MRTVSLLAFSLFCLVQTVAAQSCPVPYFVNPDHRTFYLDIPVPAGWPPNGNQNFYQVHLYNAVSEGAGGIGVAYPGAAVPNSTGHPTAYVRLSFDQDAVAQSYLVDVSYNSLTSQFTKKPYYIMNRYRRATGEDTFALGRFGASNPNDNFLFVMPLVYDSEGNFDLGVQTTCNRTTTVQAFNSRFLNKGVTKPSMGVGYLGEYFAADFHNSLYPTKKCLTCAQIAPCPDC